MTARPCKPDADFKGLWQLLLPGTPVPTCGVTQDRDTKEAKAAEPTPPPTGDGAERKS